MRPVRVLRRGQPPTVAGAGGRLSTSPQAGGFVYSDGRCFFLWLSIARLSASSWMRSDILTSVWLQPILGQLCGMRKSSQATSLERLLHALLSQQGFKWRHCTNRETHVLKIRTDERSLIYSRPAHPRRAACSAGGRGDAKAVPPSPPSLSDGGHG